MLDQWHEFFVMVGHGAAALTGLVFVALSLDLDAIIRDTTHRRRAINTLTGFTGAFVISGLALMGNQSLQAVGLEWLIVSTLLAAAYFNGVIKAKKTSGSSIGLTNSRIAGATACHAGQILGSILMVLNYEIGLYMAAASLVIYFTFMISGAWLLIIGIHINNKKSE